MKITQLNLQIEQEKYAALSPHLNERSRRIYAASEARAIGFGGKKLMSKVTGLAFETIQKGILEWDNKSTETLEIKKICKCGGGRKKNIDKDPSLKPDLENIMEESTRGDPESP